MTTHLTTSQTPASRFEDRQTQAASNNAGLQESFGQELASAFTSALKQLGIDPSRLSIQTSSTGNTRQISVTLDDSAINSSPQASRPAAAPAAQTSVVLSNDKLTFPPDAVDDAYWSEQPEAVQQLRSMPSEADREKLAETLSAEGYSIDVPVMVWGWDAGKTMALRESYGYTWVPSANNAPIQEAPGFQLPGLMAYNPDAPPAGSILVPSGAVEG